MLGPAGHPGFLDTASRVPSELTGHPHSPPAVALISLTLKCWSAQGSAQGPLSFWPCGYTSRKRQGPVANENAGPLFKNQ